MSDVAIEAPAGKAKKGGKKKLLMIVGGAVLLLGGGVAAGMFAAGVGLGGHAEAGPKIDPDQPVLVPRDGEHGESEGHAAPAAGHGEAKVDGSKYKATYFELENNFTSNLRDTDGFAQIGIGVSTYYDSRVIDRMKEHEVAIRSAILMTLADQDAFVITTPEGKAALQKKLKDTINGVLKAKTGFGGIDDVYFTSFIIQ